MQERIAERGDAMTDPFESEVRAYQRADELSPPPKNPVLFYGGSSIRFWPLLEYDFPNYPVLNRGFGGARLQDCVRLFPRLVKPYSPGIIVFYAGDNDISDDCRPQEIMDGLRAFVHLVSSSLPEDRIAIISIKPSPARRNHLNQIEEANRLIRHFTSTQPNLTYLDVYNRMLSAQGASSESLFLDDGLHMNRAGYDVWRDVVTPYLSAVFKGPLMPPGKRKEAGMSREHYQWFSPYLSRRMELLVFGDAGPQLLVFPTLHGRFHQYESHGVVEALRHRLEGGTLQLLCVDSLDAEILYNRSLSPRERIVRYMDFEKYILREILPFAERINRNSSVTLHGCSLGAYHSVNIAFRHPHLFEGILALSGRFDLTRSIGAGFPDLFDGFYDDDIYFNTPSHFLANLTDPVLLQQIRGLRVTLAIGELDDFIDNNRAFSQVLSRRGITHALHVWPGTAHHFHDWREMVRRYS